MTNTNGDNMFRLCIYLDTLRNQKSNLINSEQLLCIVKTVESEESIEKLSELETKHYLKLKELSTETEWKNINQILSNFNKNWCNRNVIYSELEKHLENCSLKLADEYFLQHIGGLKYLTQYKPLKIRLRNKATQIRTSHLKSLMESNKWDEAEQLFNEKDETFHDYVAQYKNILMLNIGIIITQALEDPIKISFEERFKRTYPGINFKYVKDQYVVQIHKMFKETFDRADVVKSSLIINTFDFCFTKDQSITIFKDIFVQSLPLHPHKISVDAAKLLIAFKGYLAMLKPKNTSYEEFTIFVRGIIDEKYPKDQYNFPNSYKTLLKLSLVNLFANGQFDDEKLFYEDNKEYISRSEYDKLKEKAVNGLARDLILELPQSYDVIDKLYQHNVDVFDKSLWNDIQKKYVKLSLINLFNNGRFDDGKLFYEDNKEYISITECNKLRAEVVSKLTKNLSLKLPQSYDSIHKLYKQNIDVFDKSLWNDIHKKYVELSLINLFNNGRFDDGKSFYEDNKEYISRSEYDKLKEKVVNGLAGDLILKLPQSYDSIHKLYKQNVDVFDKSLWNDIQKKHEELLQKEKINDKFENLKKLSKSYTGDNEQLVLKDALLSELRSLYKKYAIFFSDSMIEDISHIKQSCGLKDLVKRKMLKLDVGTDIYFISEYHKYSIQKHYKSSDPRFDNFSSMILQLKHSSIDSVEYFSKRLNNILGLQIVMCSVPSSSIENPNNGIKEIIKKIARPNRIDGSSCLVRTTPIQKLSNGGDRSKEVHYNSIKCFNTQCISGKIVVLLDDVTTTGNSLNACRDILLKDGAKEVICVALGMTVAD